MTETGSHVAERRRLGPRVLLLGLVVLSALLGIGIWLVDVSPAAPIAADVENAKEPELAPAPAPLQPTPVRTLGARAPALQPQLETAPQSPQPMAAKLEGYRSAGARLNSAQLKELLDRPDRQARLLSRDLHSPQPLASDRPRLQQRLELESELNDAVQRGEPAAMRPLIARYRELAPNDPLRTGEGYERLAECLEHPGAESRAAAQAYYDAAKLPRMRAAIERTCLATR